MQMKTTDFFAENNPTLFPVEMDVDISDLLDCIAVFKTCLIQKYL